MLWILVSFLVLSAAGGAAYVYSQSEKSKSVEILRDLGIQERTQGENITPYYKWLWEQNTEDCVSAGRLVRQAFQNARIWIDSDDLDFFRGICLRYQSGTKIDITEIVNRVNQMVARTAALDRLIGEQVETIMQRVLSSSEQEARERLKPFGILAEAGVAVPKYGQLEIKNLLNRIGSQVLGLENRGLSIIEPETGRNLELHGLDIWEHCIYAVRNRITAILDSRKAAMAPPLFRALKTRLERGLLTEYEDDLFKARAFIDALRHAIEAKQIALTVEQVERCDLIFYGWKFAKGIAFKQADHDRLRELLTNENLSFHFRRLVLNHIDNWIGSLGPIVDLFPRCVFFYGSQDKARKYARSIYFDSIEALLDGLAVPANRFLEPPILLEIPQDELKSVLPGDRGSSNANSMVYATASHARDGSPDFGKLIIKHQRLLMLDREIAAEDAGRRGWLIDLPVTELESIGINHGESDQFSSFACFSCDTSNRNDFESETETSIRKRMQFIARMFDSLIDFRLKNTQAEIEIPASV